VFGRAHRADILLEQMTRDARTDTGRIRVVVVEDHPVVRDIIRLACEERPQIEIVGETAHGEEAVDLCASLRPDVVILDVVLPGIDGFEVVRRLQHRGSPPRVLVVTARSDQQAVFEARRLGVQGFLDKTALSQRVADSVLAVAGGERVYTAEQDRAAVSYLGGVVRAARDRHRLETQMTPREAEVLKLLSRGATTRQVASRLGISERTVQSHISKLYRKLDARTRVGAVAKAMRLGLIHPEPGP
jgi:DNA-binding NarL/FixJ family response regulator